MHYLYILHSTNHNKFYIGQTPDLETRMLFHDQLSKTSFTSKYRPWTVFFFFNTPNRSVAMKMEKYLKKKNKAFISRINDDTDLQNYISNKFLL